MFKGRYVHIGCGRQPVRASTTLLLSGLFAIGLGCSTGWANPKGGSVVTGGVTIAPGEKSLTINQTSNKAIVNWQSFSIGAGEKTRINLPSSLSTILNRVVGADPSLIAGQLSSNGKVYLINPNGIVVGPNGRIDTGAFIASTLNVPDSAFMRGGGMTFKGDSGAGIKVFGRITATDGDVVLVAAVVDNQGRIAAPNGQAILGAGGQFYYVPDGQSDIVIQAPPDTGAASVNNDGTIAAASAQLKAAGNPYALAINNGGTVSATAVREIGGRVVLDGGAGDTVNTGTIGARIGDKGGTVAISGQRVTLAPTATVDVSGPAGGGTAKVGGGSRGADPKIANAGTTAVAAGARILADATDKGDGGSVVVWSGGVTDFAGGIRAKGGPNGGNGGTAEISGRSLAFAGTVDLTAPRGRVGNLLLDPASLDICDACGTKPAAIEAALVGSGITVLADSDLSVSSPITSPSLFELSLDAPNIAVNASISLVNGTLTFQNSSPTIGGTLSSAASAMISAGRINVTGNYAVTNFAGPVAAGSLFFDLPSLTATSITVNNAANGIDEVFFEPSRVNLSGDVSISSSLATQLDGGAATTGAFTFVAAGDLTVGAGATLAVSGTTTLASTGGTFVNFAGTGLVAGTGRTVIYASTDVGFDDGGLGYTQYNPVALGSDPLPGLTGVTYIAHASSLPALTITADDKSRFYGDADPTLTATLSGGTASDLALPVQLAIGNGPDTNAGSYTIVPSGAISSAKALAFVNGALTVTPAPLTITAKDQSQPYGSPFVFAGTEFTPTGLKNSETVGSVTLASSGDTATASVAGGPYAIVPSAVTGGSFSAGNYSISYVNGSLSVTPTALTITARNQSQTYGSPFVFAGTEFTPTGLKNGETVGSVTLASSGDTATASVAGEPYSIVPSSPTGGTFSASNYNIGFANGALSVTPASLTITAKDQSQTYGAPFVFAGTEFTPTGLKNGETVGSVTLTSSGDTATASVAGGPYAIVPSAATGGSFSAGNYSGQLRQRRAVGDPGLADDHGEGPEPDLRGALRLCRDGVHAYRPEERRDGGVGDAGE